MHNDACRVWITKPGVEGEAGKKQFTFDAAYDEKSTQKQFYEESCYPLVEAVMEGFNGTIFASGAAWSPRRASRGKPFAAGESCAGGVSSRNCMCSRLGTRFRLGAKSLAIRANTHAT